MEGVTKSMGFNSKFRVHSISKLCFSDMVLELICTNMGVLIRHNGQFFSLISQHHSYFDPFTTYGPCANFSKSSLGVATSKGNVLIFSVYKPADNLKLDVSYRGTTELTNSPITVMAGDESGIALSDHAGMLLYFDLFSSDDVKLQEVKLSQYHTEATAISLTENYIIVGTISGKILVYRRSELVLKFETDAHAKAVSSISVKKEIILSASEDGFVRVWRLENDAFIHTQSIPIENAYLTAVSFIGDTHFSAISYNDRNLKIFNATVV